MNVIAPPQSAPCAFKGCRGFFYPGTAETGVVLCAPWGVEELATRAAWQHLAEAIAAAGYPCLRFDYPGTGASLGSMTSIADISQWTQAAGAATGFLRAYSGVKRFVLIGQSLGAAIAMEAAAQRADIASLILVAPAANGAAYARGLRALANNANENTDLGLAGYSLSAPMMASLKRLDPLRNGTGGLKSVVVFDRADRKAGAHVSEHFRRHGLASSLEIIPPYRGTEFRAGAFKPLPAAAGSIVAALRKCHPPGERTAAPRLPCLPATLRAASFREEPLPAGPDGLFRDLLCQPANPFADRQVLIVLDEGPSPQTGWRRMAVDLTRALAASGHATLRLDIQGTTAGALPHILSHSIEALQARGISEIALAALGPAAGLALRALDPRISHAVAIDATGLAADNAEDPVLDSASSLFALAIGKTLSRPSRRHPGDEKTLFFQDLIAAAQRHRRRTIRERARERLRDLFRRGLDRLKAKLPAGIQGLMLRDPGPARVKDLFSDLAQAGTRVSLVYSGEPDSLRELASHSGYLGRRLNASVCTVSLIPGGGQNPTAPEAASWLLDHLIYAAHEMAHRAARTDHQAAA
jgi:pimeloyl-ACP methyl ester carboxylesterase